MRRKKKRKEEARALLVFLKGEARCVGHFRMTRARCKAILHENGTRGLVERDFHMSA